MKKSVVKPRSKGTLSRLPGTFRPHVETLECRAQPGSVLGLGGSVLGAAALDLNSGTDVATQRHEAVIVQRNLARDNDLALQIHYSGLDGSQGSETAPVQQLAATTAPVQAASQSSLSFQDQVHSVSAHVAQAAAATHPAYTLGQGSTAAPVHVTPFNQASNQSHTGTITASAEALSMDHVVAATPTRATVDLGLHAVSGLNVTVLHYTKTSDQPPPPTVNLIYDSYVGTGNPDSTGVFGDKVTGSKALAADGSSLVTGFITDPNTGLHDAFVAKIDPNGVSFTAAVVADPAGASDFQGNSVDIGSDGAIYVVGTSSAPGSLATPESLPLGQLFAFRFEPDMSAIDWAVQGNPMLQTQANAGRIGEDPTVGESLLVTGGLIDPSTGLSDILILRVSGLSSDPATEVIDGGGFAFGDPRTGGAGNTVGLSIVQDGNAGYAYAAGGLGQGTASTAFLAITGIGGDFTTANGLYLNAPAPNATWNSVDLDPATGNIFLAGTYFNTDHQSLLLSAFSFDGTTVSSVYTSGGMQIGGWLWTATIGGVPIDWFGTGNGVIPNSGGEQTALGTLNDPSNPGGVINLFRVGPNGDMSLDGFIFIGGGSNDDQTAGLSIIPDPMGGNDYYSGGFTNSPDFATTPTSFLPNDPDSTGTLYEGWVDVEQII